MFAEADARRRADFAAADANAADLRKRGEYDVEPVSDRWSYTTAVAKADYARMSAVISQLEPPSSEKAARHISAVREAASKKAYAEAQKSSSEVQHDGAYPVETWRGERIVDGLVKVHNKTLRIERGTTVRFTATGRLVVTGNIEAFGATFEGEGTAITNDWRILTSCGGARIEGCTFRNLPAVRNRGWGWGFMRLGGGERGKRPVVVRASRFENTAGFGIMQSADDRIELNSFVGGSGGVILLEGLSARVTGNVFTNLSDTGVRSDGATLPTIDGNVFIGCDTALVVNYPTDGYLVGNVIFGGSVGLRAQCETEDVKAPVFVSGNWFGGQSYRKILYRKSFHAKAVRIPSPLPSVPEASDVGERPLWMAGLMTDTHVGSTPESCERVRMACELFAGLGVDLVANTGDIADEYCEAGYRELRRIYDRAFVGKKPVEIWVYANHDTNDGANRPKEVLWTGMRKALGIVHDPYSVTDFHGYPLVTIPQSYNYDRTAKMLQDVCADPKWAGKPVFVFDHVPPLATTEDSVTWGQAGRRELYSRFPRVVVISGHAHGSLRSEQNIWQGEFTALGLGCLQNWSGHAVGGAPENKDSYDVAILEVYPNRLVIRRFDIRDKSEYHASDPWCVPLPFDPKTAPYCRERTARTEPVPQFGKGAALKLTPVGAPCTSVRLDFPAAEGPNGTYQYRLEIIDERGVKFARQDVFGQFWLPERERRAMLSQELSAGYFEPGHRSRVVVTPVNAFGVGGKSLEADLLMPSSVVGTTLWEASDPMGDCSFMTELADGSPVPLKDGWYQVGTGDHRLEFPASAWNCPIGTRMRVTVDLEMEQPELRTWTMVLRHPTPLANATSRVATPPGAPGVQRYVMEFKKWQSDYYLLIREGSHGRIRFRRIKTERLDEKK